MRRSLLVLCLLLAAGATMDAQRSRARRVRANPLISSRQTCTGNVYYVRTDGNNANAGTANTAGGAWQTITKGMQTAVAGDCVRVQAGTYAETAGTSANSGTSGNTITVIADGAVTTCGLTLASKSYIRLIGFTFDPSTGGCANSHAVNGTGTNTGLEFWNITVPQVPSNNKAYNFDRGAGSNECVSCIFIGGSIAGIGPTSGVVAMLVSGNDTFIGYIAFSDICYVGIGPSGSRMRMVNNNFSGFVQCASYHPDFFYISPDANGFSSDVIEASFGVGTPTSTDNKFHHQENSGGLSPPAWTDNVYRFNVATQLGSGGPSLYVKTGGADNLRTHFYHNTWVQPNRAVGSSAAAGSGTSTVAGKTVSADFLNTIYYETWGAALTTGIDGVWTPQGGAGTTTVTYDYSLAYDPDQSVTMSANWTGQAHTLTNTDPLFTNFAGQDYTLQSGSTARGFGAALTTASGSGSGSTSLTVASGTGGFFIGDNAANLAAYSGKLVPGDPIRVGTCNSTVSSVSGDTITLASACTWSNADPVYYGDTSTIDLGAYPYKASYTLTATKNCVSGTCTITPNDASLVRFVVCYEAGVPYAVSNASPFTCGTPTGAFEARVYPRYASQTRWVVVN